MKSLIKNTIPKILALNITLLCQAEEYPYSYRSGYYLGRGDTGIAVADDEEAVFYNPAGLAVGKGIFKRIILLSPYVEVSKDTRDVVREITLQDSDPTETLRHHEGKPQHVGVANFSGVILRKVAIGIYGYSTSTILLFKDHEQGAFETIDAHSRTDLGLTFSLAHQLGKSNFYAGTTLKYIKRTEATIYANATDTSQVSKMSENNSLAMTGTGTGADVGLMYRSNTRTELALGLTINDVGGIQFIPEKSTDLPKNERPLKDNKQTINLGLAIVPGTKISKFKILADYRDILNSYDMSSFKKLHIGGELTVLDIVGMTGGLNQGYPSFGLYLDTRVVRFDIGAYGEEQGKYAGSRPDTRIFMKLSMGL